MTARLVLASKSPARATMLRAAGLNFILDPARIDEAAIRDSLRAEGASARDAAEALAEAKAMQAGRRAAPFDLILGADQMLECEGRWFEKPSDRDAAYEQLAALRGRRHSLHSAAVLVRGGQTIWRAIDAAHLWMRMASDDFLQDYLAQEGAEAIQTVGAYKLEGRGTQLFSCIEGDYFTILGLPLLPLLQALRDQGLLPS